MLSVRRWLILPLVIASLFVVLLTGCGNGQALHEGTVTSKEYKPAYTETILISQYCGKGCFMMIPYTVYHGETWKLKVDGTPVTHVEGGRQVVVTPHGHMFVSEDFYNSVNVGDYVTDDEAIKPVVKKERSGG